MSPALRHALSWLLHGGGLDWDASRIDDERDRRTIEQALRAHHLLDVPQDANEVVRVIRGIASLEPDASGEHGVDRRGNRCAFLPVRLQRAPCPGSLSNGTQTDTQLVAIELAHLTAQSLALRGSGNLLVFHGRDGLMDELAASVLYRVSLPQPDSEEKLRFLEVAGTVYPKAGFDGGLLPEQVAHLTTNTPNRGLESLLRASHRTGRRLTARELSAPKEPRRRVAVGPDADRARSRADRRCAPVRGEHRRPLTMLLKLASALRRGDPSMPANVLLVGPPGTGKTDLALDDRSRGRSGCLRDAQPETGLRRTDRDAGAEAAVAPQGVATEHRLYRRITESLPMERSEFDGDSGATRAVMGTLLTALSDETRRGRSLLIATTNTPWRMSAAMRSRFTMLPVLYPLREDLPAIVAHHGGLRVGERSIRCERCADHRRQRVVPRERRKSRHILAALSNALLIHGQLTPDTVYSRRTIYAVQMTVCQRCMPDLWAVRCCSLPDVLPGAPRPRPTHSPST